MKASVTQQQLAHALSLAGRAVSSRSSLPVLSNILIATDGGRLRISATNLELGITCWIDATVQEEGAITVPARTFSDLVSTLPVDSVMLTVNTLTQTLNVVCGTSNTDIKGIDAQEFPPMPVPDLNEAIDLNVEDFKEMIQQVAFAASTEDARPVLQGAQMKIEGSQVTLAATDGFRISVRRAALSSPAPRAVSAIIPARALSELARMAADGDQALQMVIQPNRGQIIFKLKNAELASQLIEGNFPDYNVIIPKNPPKTRSVFTTEQFLKSCRQAEIIARDSNNVIRMSIRPAEAMMGQVEISAQSEETGSSEIELGANIEGAAITIAFNVAYLRAALEVMHTREVALETNANNTPALLLPVGNTDFTHVIMPMYLG